MQAWEEQYYAKQEGIEEGEYALLVSQIKKKLAKGKSVEIIADEVEERVERVTQIISELPSEMNEAY